MYSPVTLPWAVTWLARSTAIATVWRGRGRPWLWKPYGSLSDRIASADAVAADAIFVFQGRFRDLTDIHRHLRAPFTQEIAASSPAGVLPIALVRGERSLGGHQEDTCLSGHALGSGRELAQCLLDGCGLGCGVKVVQSLSE